MLCKCFSLPLWSKGETCKKPNFICGNREENLSSAKWNLVKSCSRCSKAGTSGHAQIVRAEVFSKPGIFSRLGNFLLPMLSILLSVRTVCVGCLPRKNLHIIQQTSLFLQSQGSFFELNILVVLLEAQQTATWLCLCICDKQGTCQYVVLSESVLDIRLQLYADPAYCLLYSTSITQISQIPLWRSTIVKSPVNGVSFSYFFFQLQPFTASLGT